MNSLEEIEKEDKENRSRTLSALYAVVMLLMSAYLIQPHSRHWRKWALGVGGTLYLLVRSTTSGSPRK